MPERPQVTRSLLDRTEVRVEDKIVKESHPGHPDDIIREEAEAVVRETFPNLPDSERKELVDEIVQKTAPPSYYGEFGQL